MGKCPYFAPLSAPVLRKRRAPITRKPLAPVMMNFKKFPWIPVGADLSRPPPLYRPSADVRYPYEKVKTHHRRCYKCTWPCSLAPSRKPTCCPHLTHSIQYSLIRHARYFFSAAEIPSLSSGFALSRAP